MYVKMLGVCRSVKLNAPEGNPFDRIPKDNGIRNIKAARLHHKETRWCDSFSSIPLHKHKWKIMKICRARSEIVFLFVVHGCRGCLSARNQCKKCFLLSLHFVKHERHFSRFSPFWQVQTFCAIVRLRSHKKGTERIFPINRIIIIFMEMSAPRKTLT